MSAAPGERTAEAQHDLVGHAARMRHTHQLFWVRYVRMGMLVSLLTSIALLVYVALTTDGPHRSGLRAVAVLLGFTVVLILAAPTGRIVRGRFRWPFFLTWSLGCVAIAGLATALDGGGSSPVATALFLPLLYAAMAYPPRAVMLVAAAILTTFSVVSVTDGSARNGPAEVLIGMVLALSSVMAVVGARHRALQARALGRIRRLLAREATVDPLTGCANRRAFFDRLGIEAARAARYGRPLALLSVDIDHFKQINDSFGHPTGDEVLVALADALRRHTRPADVVARLGGDEFNVLLPECGGADAERLAVRLRAAIVTAHGLPPVRISVGAAAADGTGPIDPAGLVAAADRALYAAKRRPAPPAAPAAVG